MLKVRETQVTQARYPVVDVHTHFGHRMRGARDELTDFVARMDRNRIAVCVSMDGFLPDRFEQQKKFLWKEHRDRFVIFVRIDWWGDGKKNEPGSWACNQVGFVRRFLLQLEHAAQNGVSGLKLAKGFGLTYRDGNGDLLKIDDPRWDPIWKKCGELKLPILIHTADPAAFFLPVDATNERWEELSRHPDWSFYGDSFPSRKALLEARNRVLRRHPRTTFIGAHMANNAEDLQEVANWLDQHPNLYVEFASRIGELGRQPYTARRFLIKYADRVLFGTDGPWPERRLHKYWRFLETQDEYFPYSEKEVPPQGLWQIYGVGLPDDVLQKIYFANAARFVPGVAERLSRQ